jgi:hypothetical protein
MVSVSGRLWKQRWCVLPKNACNAPLLPLIVDLIITFVATPRAAISDIQRKAAINSQLS